VCLRQQRSTLGYRHKATQTRTHSEFLEDESDDDCEKGIIKPKSRIIAATSKAKQSNKTNYKSAPFLVVAVVVAVAVAAVAAAIYLDS
jgi:hypothetical protein